MNEILKKDKINKIRRAVHQILNKEPAYGHLIQQIDFLYYEEKDFFSFPELKETYAGISCHKKYVIHVNLEKMIEKSRDFIIEVLKHEVGHIMQGSFARAKYLNITDQQTFQRWNIASDIPINESLPLLHDFGFTSKKLGFEQNQTSEYYFDLLGKNPPKKKMECKLDAHDFSSELSPEEIKYISKKLVENAIKEVRKAAGKVPSEFLQSLEILSTSKYNWIKELNKVWGQYLGATYRRTRARVNRRYGHFMGKAKETKGLITVVIDTSGSVTQKMLQMFFREIKKIQSQGYDVSIIECDAKVQRHYKYVPSKKFTVQGGGGTLYQPAIDYAVSLKPAIILIFGDGGYFDNNLNEPDNVKWILPKGCDAQTNNKKIFLDC